MAAVVAAPGRVASYARTTSPTMQIIGKRDLRRAIRAIKRIGLEVEALRALSPHENINGLVDALHTPDNVHLVLERADSDLYDWYEGPVSEVEARHVTGQVRSRRIRRAFCESFGSAGFSLACFGFFFRVGRCGSHPFRLSPRSRAAGGVPGGAPHPLAPPPCVCVRSPSAPARSSRSRSSTATRTRSRTATSRWDL